MKLRIGEAAGLEGELEEAEEESLGRSEGSQSRCTPTHHYSGMHQTVLLDSMPDSRESGPRASTRHTPHRMEKGNMGMCMRAPRSTWSLVCFAGLAAVAILLTIREGLAVVLGRAIAVRIAGLSAALQLRSQAQKAARRARILKVEPPIVLSGCHIRARAPTG